MQFACAHYSPHGGATYSFRIMRDAAAARDRSAGTSPAPCWRWTPGNQDWRLKLSSVPT